MAMTGNGAGGMYRPRHSRWLVMAMLVSLTGCADYWYTVTAVGLNDRLRRDREPLTPTQTTQDLESLRYGPYAFAANELVSPLVPAEAPLTQVPQSDCWWMASSPFGGGDAMLGNWELTAELRGDGDELFVDEEDGRLDLGMCRLDDPQTRRPPTSVDDDSDYFPEVDCSAFGNVLERIPDAFDAGGNFFRCTADAALANAVLNAWSPTTADPMNRCPRPSNGFDRLDRRIGLDVDFYGGVSIESGGQTYVAGCSRPDGETLVPGQATQYQLEDGVRGAASRRLEPALLPATAGTLLSRQMFRDDHVRRWSTPVTLGARGARWEENFSRRLAVQRVKLFEPDGAGGKRYLPYAAAAPPLCVRDLDVDGSSCRWTCAATAAANGDLQYELLDGSSCRLGRAAPAALRATPTYDLTREALTTAGSGSAFVDPLVWSVASPQDDLWIEFEMLPLLATTALRTDGLVSVGAARVGEYTRASYRVVNDGAHPLRITAVATAPAHGGNPGDFVPQLPALPKAVALPIATTQHDEETVVRVSPDAERQVLFTMTGDRFHQRLGPRGGGFTTRVNNISVRDDHGLLLRDVAAADFRVDPRLNPMARTTYALRTPPFTLMPGESFEVSVRAKPGAVGDRYAFVRVDAHSVVDASQRRSVLTRVEVVGLRGPAVSFLPRHVVFSAVGSGESQRRAVMIQNVGDSAATIGAPILELLDGSPLPAGSQLALDDPYNGGGQLAVQGSRVVRVLFESDCSRGVVRDYHDETVVARWSTPDGPLRAPISASTYCGP